MPRPSQLFESFDPITADFTYIRWLGDRKGIEERTKMWDKVIVDRTPDSPSGLRSCARFTSAGSRFLPTPTITMLDTLPPPWNSSSQC